MAEALIIIPMISALTGTSMMAMLTMGPEGGVIKAVKKKVNSMSYDDQIWNKTNTSTGQLSVQFTALTQWMSTMAQYGNTRNRQLNSVRLELSLPIRREFKDNDGKIKVLEPFPLVPHYYHVPRVGQMWRFSLSHFPALAEHRAQKYPQRNPTKRQRKKIDKLYSVWIESIGYKATDDVTAFKITWPKDNPTLFNYWNTMIWMLTRYDFNTGLVMENIRAAMQPNPHPLLENDVLALFAQVKMDDLKIQNEMKAKEATIISPYPSNISSDNKSKNTCQTTTLDVPLSFNYRGNHPKSEKPKKRRVYESSDEDEERPKQVVLVLKTSSTNKKKSNTQKMEKSRPASPSGSVSGFSGLFSKKGKENTTPTNTKKQMRWQDEDDDDGCELSLNPLQTFSLDKNTASMISRLSMQDDDDFSHSRSVPSYASPMDELQTHHKKNKKAGTKTRTGMDRLRGNDRRPSIDI